MPFKNPSRTSEYIRSLLLSETDADLKEVLAYADASVVPVLLPETAAFLKQAVILKQPKKILEIGTAIGYSGMLMLKNSAADLCTVEMDESKITAARDFFERAGLKRRVTVFVGDASDIVPLIDGSFDFIFLDGPKTKYPVYYPYLKRLLAKGGVLLADNVLFNGMVDGSGEFAAKKATIAKGLDSFLRTAMNDEDFVSAVLPVGDGLYMGIKTGEKR